ncbi:MAG: carboxypeptidase-like regulatory domain-containing protein [Candidatus Acidiferrum sp.]
MNLQPSIRDFAIVFTLASWPLCGPPAFGQHPDTDAFELRGSVINAATGEPVSGALVEMQAPVSKVQFSGTNGMFVFTNLPRGQYFVTSRKPGFFNEQELGRSSVRVNSMRVVPSDGELLLKLTPEAIIYGELKNENGDPLEGVTVRAQRWQTVDGRRSFQNMRDAVTDDEGTFRIAELKPGRYRLAFVETNRGGSITLYRLSRKRNADQGYGSQFYPGVSDPELATTIDLRAGSQLHITQSLGPQRLYEVVGVVRGVDLENGFTVMLTNSDGDIVQKSMRLDPKMGGFQISGVPEGAYMLTATAFARNDERTREFRRQQTATQLIHVSSDVSGLVLPLGRGISLRVQVDGVISPVSADNTPHVTVRMISKEFPQNSLGTMAPPLKSEHRALATIDDIPPGTYTVEASPNQPGYVAALRCGSVDLLREELMIASGASLPPIEVTLRSDGAQLNVTVAHNGKPAAAGVVIYSPEYPKRSLLTQTNETGTLALGSIAPGRYQVAAMDSAQDLEFRNPVAMAKVLEHATEVTLQPGDQTSVRVEVQNLQEQQP